MHTIDAVADSRVLHEPGSGLGCVYHALRLLLVYKVCLLFDKGITPGVLRRGKELDIYL